MGGEKYYIGDRFYDEVEAAIHRDERVLELGWDLPLNFPSEEEAAAALRAIGVDAAMRRDQKVREHGLPVPLKFASEEDASAALPASLTCTPAVEAALSAMAKAAIELEAEAQAEVEAEAEAAMGTAGAKRGRRHHEKEAGSKTGSKRRRSL